MDVCFTIAPSFYEAEFSKENNQIKTFSIDAISNRRAAEGSLATVLFVYDPLTFNKDVLETNKILKFFKLTQNLIIKIEAAKNENSSSDEDRPNTDARNPPRGNPGFQRQQEEEKEERRPARREPGSDSDDQEDVRVAEP